MKNNITRSIAFVALFAVIISICQWCIDTAYNSRSQNKFNLVLEHKADYEIMVWGSSIARLQIDPSKITAATGLPCYNEGWYGVFFIQYEGLIKEYLGYQKKCKCMVIACDFNDLTKNKLITRPDLFLSHVSDNNVYTSLHNIEPRKAMLARYVPGYKLGLLNKKFYMLFLNGDKGLDRNNGYSPEDRSWQASASADTPFTATINEDVYNNFRETINTITTKGIEVILVNTPVYTEGYKLIKNAEEVKSKFKALCLNNSKVHHIDYTTDTICGNRGHFYNNSHLNSAGAAIFSDKLAVDIKNILKR